MAQGSNGRNCHGRLSSDCSNTVSIAENSHRDRANRRYAGPFVPGNQQIHGPLKIVSVGDRPGWRLLHRIDFDGLKLAAAVVLLSPYVPLLFMGEEYGETAPFQYFTSHGDPDLIDAVRRGRREEFAAFRWQGEAPDPQAEETFRRSRLQPELRRDGRHRVLLDWHRELLRLRKTVPSLARPSKECLQVREFEAEKALFVRRWRDEDAIWMVFNFSDRPVRLELPAPAGTWTRLLDSSDPRWLGKGTRGVESLHSRGVVELTVETRGMALYRREAAN